MASSKLFESYPPFPDHLPVATISRISLAKLVAKDGSEALRLFEACSTKGFFMLNLEDDPIGYRFIQANTAVFGLAKEVFDISLEEKMSYRTTAPQKLHGLVLLYP